MRIAIEIRHPAQVHLFKYLIHELNASGHEVLVMALQKESSLALLKSAGIPFKTIGKNRRGLLGKFLELIRNDVLVLWYSLVFRPDVFLGHTSPSVAHVSFLLRKPYLSFSDTEHAKLIWGAAGPFMTRIVTPKCFLTDMGPRHIRYAGFHELAYLHPSRFSPNKNIREGLGLAPDESFVVLRFVSWEASHDVSHSGINDQEKRNAIKEIEKYARVFVSAEGDLPPDLSRYRLQTHPEHIHHVLAEASLFLGDSSTMASEAAILGTPAVYVSTLAAKLGYIVELAEKWGLLFFTESSEKGLAKGLEWLHDPQTPSRWNANRLSMLEHTIEVSSFMKDLSLQWGRRSRSE